MREPFVKDPALLLPPPLTDKLNMNLDVIDDETAAWACMVLVEDLEGEAGEGGAAAVADEVWGNWRGLFGGPIAPKGKNIDDGVLILFVREGNRIEVRAGDNAAALLNEGGFLEEVLSNGNAEFATKAIVKTLGEGYGLGEAGESSGGEGGGSCVIL